MPPSGEDPVRATFGPSDELQNIATWEPRSAFDKLSVRLHRALKTAGHQLVIAVAVLLFVAQLILSGFAILRAPVLGFLSLLSAVPTLALAWFVWRLDPTLRQPFFPLAVTFLLGVLFAGFAAVLNTAFQPPFLLLGALGTTLFFFVIVGPVEETVKWLATRLYAFRRPTFAAVVDGAVYGAFAGLGFATIENSIYITRAAVAAMDMGAPDALLVTAFAATVRAFAGPGHVLYAAIAGYYLGLAKFNPNRFGPIALKGILIAALVHGLYNTLVTFIDFGAGFGFLAFALVYDLLVGYYLYRLIARYRDWFERVPVENRRARGVP